jgi:arylsulfatase A-like enzyme
MPARTVEPARAEAAVGTGVPVARVPLGRLMLFSICFALLAGLLESAILATQQLLLDRIIYRSAHYLWMPAVGAVVSFSFIMLLVGLLARLLPRLGSQRVLVGILLFLTVFSALMVPRWVHPLAAAVLAAGMAIAASERMLRNASRFTRMVRTATIAMGTIVVLFAVTSFVYPGVRERSAVAALPPARDGASNIIFLILDTVRSRSLSLYGYDRATTPNLAALAQRGVVFDLAIAPSPWTLPTHASFFTGRPPHELSADRFAPLDDTYPTLAGKLAERGYASAGFVANLAYASYEFGLERGFHHWDDYQVGLEEILTNSSLSRAVLLEGFSGGRNSWLMRVLGVDHWIGNTRNVQNVNTRLLAWLGKRPEDKPFFVFANYFDAHIPYLPPAAHLGRFGPVVSAGFSQRLREERPGKWPERGDPAEEKVLLDRYEEAIRYLDAEIGELVRTLETRGLLENTVLVVSADHGEEFGEHGFYEHDTSVFLTQTHVPLLVIAPGKVPQGRRVAQPVSLVDLPATLLELGTGERGVLPGASLTDYWSAAAPAPRPVMAALDKRRHSQAALLTPQYHYIRFQTGEERLFDHTKDRAEKTNLLDTPAGAAELPALRSALRELAGEKIFRLPAPRKSAK